MLSRVIKITQRLNLDKIGISASLLCAIHCALVPLVLPLMAAIGLGFLWSHEFEIGMIALALVIGLLSLTRDYRHKHHNRMPFLLLSIGMSIILFSKIFIEPSWEFIILPIGAMFIVGAHWQNWRLHQRCSMDGHAHL